MYAIRHRGIFSRKRRFTRTRSPKFRGSGHLHIFYNDVVICSDMMENDGTIIPSAVPAASAVEHPHGINPPPLFLDDIRDEFDSAEDESIADKTDPTQKSPDSPKSFNSEDIFEEEQLSPHDDYKVTDQDLDRLLGPLPSRRTARSNLEVDVGGGDSCNSSSNWNGETKNKKQSSRVLCPCCSTTIKVGNVFVLLPRCYNQFGFGVIGPHWFGPICCLGLETGATIYYYHMAKNNVGAISACICLLFYTVGIISLCLTSCSDPGIVKSIRGGGMDGRGGLDGIGVGRNGYAGVPVRAVEQNIITARAGWRYCDLCSVYQPPDAVHCPECNVCIEGYDHHCPWMGQCIGKRNFPFFMMFNLSWLFYLFYAIIWVTFFGQASTHPEFFDGP